MMQAALEGTAVGDLPSVVDIVAGWTASWVMVECAGQILAHGPGPIPCPPALATALLAKRTAALRRATTWCRGSGVLAGSVDGVPLAAAELGHGVTAWFVGGSASERALQALSEAVNAEPLPDDAGFADLVRPRGPRRRGAAPAAVLLAVSADLALQALCREARRAVAAETARLHLVDDVLLVALPSVTAADAVATRLHSVVPEAVIGRAPVPPLASDWSAAAALAIEGMYAARGLGLWLGDAGAPDVSLEILVRKAQDAMRGFVGELPVHPLRRLRDYDARCGSELVATLTAWCRSGFDVPTAAANLHLHPNTLRYRLKRARDISGIDDAHPRQRLALQLLLDPETPR